MKVVVEKRIFLVAIIAVLLLSAISMLAFYNKNNTKENNARLRRTQSVLLQTEQTISALKELETETRGFIITNNPSFLDSNAWHVVGQHFDRLKELTNDNEIQQNNIDSLARLIELRLRLSKNVVTRVQQQRSVSDSNVQDVEHGKMVMDKIKAIVLSIQLNEQQLLAQRTGIAAANEKQVDYLFYAILVVLFLLLLLLVLSFWYKITVQKENGKSVIKLTAGNNPFHNKVQGIINGISDPFFAIDNQGNFEFINNAARKKMGFTIPGLAGNNMFEYFPAYKENNIGTKLQEVLTSREPQAFENLDESSRQWQDITIYPIEDGAVVYISDAEIRKQAEKELLKTQQFLEDTNHVAKIGGWDLDVATSKIYWSAVTREIHETAPDYIPELTDGINFYKAGDSRDAITKAVTRAMQNGGDWDLELQIVTAKGNEKWIRTKGQTEMENGQCIRVYGSFQDITQIKENALASQELADIVAHSDDAIIRTDKDDCILSWNRGASVIFGYDSTEVIGQPYSILSPEGLVDDKKAILQIFTTGKAIIAHETIGITKVARMINISTTISPIQDERGNIVAMSRIIRDTTEKIKAERAIAEERNLLKTLINNIPLNIFVKDLESKKVLVNNREMEYMGAETELDILGKDDFELYPAASAAISVGEDKEVITSGVPMKDKETYNFKNDGKGAWFLTSKIPLKNEQGDIMGVLGISYDITERKHAQELLRLSEEQFRQTFDYADVGIALVNIEDGSFRALNSSLAEMLGYTKEELMALHFRDVSHPGDRNINIQIGGIQQVIDGEVRSFKTSKRYLHKDGHTIWTELVVSSVRDNANKAFYLILQAKDVTSEKEAWKKVTETLSQLQAVLDASNQVLIIETDLAGMISIFNKGAENLLGYSAEEMIGKTTPVIIHDLDEVEKRGEELSTLLNKEVRGFDILTELPRQGNFESREWTFIRKDGTRFPVQLVVTALKVNDTIKGFLGIALDISKLKQAEATLAHSNAQLLSVNEDLEQFAYVASHDLQEPLRTITGFISLLERKYVSPLDDAAKQYMTFITEGAERMKNIIRDILAYSQTGNSTATHISVDLNLVLAGINKGFTARQEAITPVITWDVLPEVYADKTAMNQLFSNLVSNGIKYQAAGNTPLINVAVENQKNNWLFTIADNGIGIAPQFFERVFIVFQRLHTREEYDGTGVGLAICKKIINQLGGEIWLSSTVGVGTSFYFTIPKNNSILNRIQLSK